MLRYLTWISQETSRRLTPDEVDVLFAFCHQMADLGKLSNGKYVGASQPLYWQRVKGSN